ncbi:MAG TPA: divergent PAP2 family protein [bacterium]|nr:divergent PAP2 family protein [bacterium]
MKILLVPLLAAVIAQISKVFIRSNKQKLTWSALWVYSGMPSGHSAITVALTTIIGLEKGWDYPGFSIALVFTLLILRDAAGLRRQLGNHGLMLNELVADLKDDNYLDNHYPHLLERIGHTPLQIMVGSLIGFLVAVVVYFIV